MLIAMPHHPDAHVAYSAAEGPENVLDGQLGDAAATRARTHPPTTLALLDTYYAFLQLTLDRQYSDIVGVAYYISATNVVQVRAHGSRSQTLKTACVRMGMYVHCQCTAP